MYIVMKIVISAIVIGVVTEIARRFPSYGGVVAALPLGKFAQHNMAIFSGRAK